MNYTLPFKPGDKIVELGGGSTPLRIEDLTTFNVDIRPLPEVDQVRDLEEDFSDLGKFDGLLASYIAEHISWRKIKKFFKSCYNVLKDGGVAVFIVPNTYEQIKLILEKGEDEISLEDSCFLFGDQDYPENTHKTFFSKPLITKLLKEVGFNRVVIYDHPNPKARDMIVEAYREKKTEDVESLRGKEYKFEREYFEDGTYGYYMYRDFPCHYRTAKEVLDRKPESVVEFGGARGYVCKILEGFYGVKTCVVDISNHCYHTRAIDNYIRCDISRERVPIKDKEYDLCFSIAFLEHIPEDRVEHVIRESIRVSKRGLHGITFKKEPYDIDKTHVTMKPKEWWIEKFGEVDPSYPVEIVDKEDLERPPYPIPHKDNLLKVNFGSFTNMFHNWVNCDIIDLSDFAKRNGYIFKKVDVRERLPFFDNEVDVIVAHHLIEHLTREEGYKFLKECYRILKEGGVIRLSTPSIKTISYHYNIGDLREYYKDLNKGVEESRDNSEAFYRLLFEGHKTLYDGEDLKRIMEEIGFVNVEISKFNQSRSEAIRRETIDSYPTLSVYVEGEKPVDLSQQLEPYQEYLRGLIKEGRQSEDCLN